MTCAIKQPSQNSMEAKEWKPQNTVGASAVRRFNWRDQIQDQDMSIRQFNAIATSNECPTRCIKSISGIDSCLRTCSQSVWQHCKLNNCKSVGDIMRAIELSVETCIDWQTDLEIVCGI